MRLPTLYLLVHNWQHACKSIILWVRYDAWCYTSTECTGTSTGTGLRLSLRMHTGKLCYSKLSSTVPTRHTRQDSKKWKTNVKKYEIRALNIELTTLIYSYLLFVFGDANCNWQLTTLASCHWVLGAWCVLCSSVIRLPHHAGVFVDKPTRYVGLR